jgi:dCMP deaminase
MTTTSSRPSWDEWGLILALAVAARADCSRRRVGAVLMTPDHTIVATGYNGAAPGEQGCLAGGCPRALSGVEPTSSYDAGPGTCVAIHAEQNALLRASWAEQQGSTLYCTDEPCAGCLRTVKGSAVARVIAPNFRWERPSRP